MKDCAKLNLSVTNKTPIQINESGFQGGRQTAQGGEAQIHKNINTDRGQGKMSP